MTKPPLPDDADRGVPQDPWLREALRHAPDADAAPPPALGEAILRAARAQAAGATAPAPSAGAAPLLQHLLDLWAWLARPPVAAGFASLMVVTVVGVMWWNRPLEDALPPRETAVPAPAPAAPAADTPAGAEPPRPPAPVAPAPQRVPVPAPRSAPATPPAPATAAREAQARRDAAAARDESLRERQAELAAKVDDTERRKATAVDSALGSAPQTPGTEAATAAAAAPAARAAPSSVRRSTATPLGGLRASIATEPERWSWQRDAGPAMPMSTAVMQWLQRAGETARSHWTPADERPDTAAAASGTRLVLLRDGRVHTTLRLGAEGIEVEATPSAPGQRAALPAAEAAALRVELDQATR